MVALNYTFEGGTNGNPIAVPTGGNGSDWDSVTIGASATLNWDNTHPGHGTLAAKIATGASAVSSSAQWTTALGTPSQIFGRCCLYFTANPTVNAPFGRGLASGAQKYRLVVTTGGKVQLLNAANTQAAITTNSIPLNQEFRVEWQAVGSATGAFQLLLFSNKDDTSALETLSGTDNFTAGNYDEVRFGVGTGVANVVAYWLDDAAVNDTGLVGPVAGPAVATRPFVRMQAGNRAANY
jgi:hypothetical protein